MNRPGNLYIGLTKASRIERVVLAANVTQTTGLGSGNTTFRASYPTNLGDSRLL